MDSSIWDQILSRVEGKVNRHSFSTWFKATAFIADGGRSITVRVPNTLFKDWLTKHYSVVLSEALAEVRRGDASLVFVAEPGAAFPAPEKPIAAGGGGRRPRGDKGTAHACGSQSAVHVRHIHRRAVEPVRARGVPRRGRGSL